MSPEMLLELVGYFASLLVLVSLLMTSVVKLRVINMVGSLIFAIYALCIGSLPTAVMNFCLVGVNIFYLVRMARTEQFFTLLPAEPDGLYFKHFLDFHRADIQTYFPGFEGEAVQAGATVTFTRPKPGLYLGEGAACSGQVQAVDIGIPRDLEFELLDRRTGGACQSGAILFSNEYGPLGQTEAVKEIVNAWK